MTMYMHIEIYEWCSIFVVLILLGAAIWMHNNYINAWALGASALFVALLTGGVSMWRRHQHEKHVHFIVNSTHEDTAAYNTDSEPETDADMSDAASDTPLLKHQWPITLTPIETTATIHDEDSDTEPLVAPTPPDDNDRKPPKSLSAPPRPPGRPAAPSTPPPRPPQHATKPLVAIRPDAPQVIDMHDIKSRAGKYVYPTSGARVNIDANRARFIEGNIGDLDEIVGGYTYNPETGTLSADDDIFGPLNVSIIQENNTTCDNDVFGLVEECVGDGENDIVPEKFTSKLSAFYKYLSFNNLACTHGVIGEYMQTRANAVFCIPAQMNGTEYQNETDIVYHLQSYVDYPTVGSAGQLAAHPAVAQFILDNAENTATPDKGINNIREVLRTINIGVTPSESHLVLQNGYLLLMENNKINVADNIDIMPDETNTRNINGCLNLNAMKLLIARNVSMIGHNRPVTGPYNIGDIAYASAMPYNNRYLPGHHRKTARYSRILALMILYAQFNALLQYAIRETKDIVLLPIGSGAPNNIEADIIVAIQLACATQTRVSCTVCRAAYGNYPPKPPTHHTHGASATLPNITLLCASANESAMYANYCHAYNPHSMAPVLTEPESEPELDADTKFLQQFISQAR